MDLTTCKKSREKVKPYHAVFAVPDDDKVKAVALTDSDKEKSILATMMGKDFAKQYPATLEDFQIAGGALLDNPTSS